MCWVHVLILVTLSSLTCGRISHNLQGTRALDKILSMRRHHKTDPSSATEFHTRTFNLKAIPQTESSVSGSNIFRAIWNVPNSCAERHGINFPLADFGIEFNKNHNWNFGDVVNDFNEGDIGYYPYVDRVSQRYVNGGLPQLANITAHLEKATSDLLAAIPNPDFDGVGMIDWEEWHPHWDAIEGRYRTYSMDHVRSLHPDWDNATITAIARLEWTQGAKLFMESTLKLAKQLRPKALWGFYHYPYCNIRSSNASCKPNQYVIDDEIMWLYDEATVLYPSIYLPQNEYFLSAKVKAELTEAFRVRDKSSDPKGPVLSYTRFNYSSTELYYSLEDLNHTILTSAEFGTNGVVFWGDNYDDRTAQTCQELNDYITKALGPILLMAREGATACSERVCSGTGRCVGHVLTCSKGGRMPKLKTGEDFVRLFGSDVCSCRCFIGWEGSDCSVPVKD